MKIRKAIIPAAGLGTRFLPASKAIPKEMLPLYDRPTIEYIVREAVASGIEQILIILGRNKGVIEDHFDKSYELEHILEKDGKHSLLNKVKDISNLASMSYVRQKEALGLGHAVYCAKDFVGDEPFVVLLGDDIVDGKVPCTRQLVDTFYEEQKSVLGVQQVALSEVSKYGIVAGEKQRADLWQVRFLVEKPEMKEAPSQVAILGRYVLTPGIFPILAQTKPGKNGEIQLTDALSKLAQEEGMVAKVFSGNRFDAGDKLGFVKATLHFAWQDENIRKDLNQYIVETLSSEFYRERKE